MKRGTKRIVWFCVVAAVLLLLLYACLWAFHAHAAKENSILSDDLTRIHILDVGQADAIVVTSGGEAMLIDAGEWDTASYVMSYLSDLGIETLTKVVCTHPHSDHIGGMPDVLDRFDAEEVILPYAVYETYTYESLLKTISRQNLAVYEPIPGESVPFGDGELLMLSPEPETAWAEINNESVVFIFSVNGAKMLFTGDAEMEVEENLLRSGYDIDCDLIKVAHHGSRSSSTEAFLDAVTPDYAFVTCETDSENYLPAGSVLARYETRDCEVWRTDESGTIVITIDESGRIAVSADGEKS